MKPPTPHLREQMRNQTGLETVAVLDLVALIRKQRAAVHALPQSLKRVPHVTHVHVHRRNLHGAQNLMHPNGSRQMLDIKSVGA